MAFAPIRRPRLNLPSGEGLDWSNPLTRDLRVALNGFGGTDHVKGRMPTYTGLVKGATTYGIGSQVNATTDMIYESESGLSGTVFTFLICGMFAYLGGSGTSRVIHWGDTIFGSGVFLTGSDATLEIGIGNGGITNYSISNFWTTAYLSGVYLIEVVGGSALTAYRNGSLVGSVSIGTIGNPSTKQLIVLNRSDGIRSAGVGKVLNTLLVWNRTLTPAEKLSVSVNPAQVFL